MKASLEKAGDILGLPILQFCILSLQAWFAVDFLIGAPF
jgi:hypothetical protein